MATQFGTGRRSGTDGRSVGRQAAEAATIGIGGSNVDFCQVFCSTRYDYHAVIDGIRSVIGPDAELLGCSSAGEFTEEGVEAGSVAVGVVASDDMQFFTSMETGLSEDVNRCVMETVDDLPSSGDRVIADYPHRAAINLHDGLAGVGNQVARATKHQLGDDVALAGGSAGDDLQLEETHVFCNDAVETDAVGLALIASRKPIAMTVDHGHEPISEPMTVTKAEGSTVYELDGKPAFEAWKDVIREDAMETYGVDVDEIEDASDDLSFTLTRYEFGIESEPGDPDGIVASIKKFVTRNLVSTSGYNIRWPGLTRTTDGPFEFAVEVPEGTELRVMHSGPQDQIDSVQSAARAAMDRANGTGVAGGFVYDCVCRATILEDDFDQALDAISEAVEAPFAGFETYGEVCTESDDLTGYHNTTSVVMLLPE